MLSVTTGEYATPASYELTEHPLPSIDNPEDIVIKVHAASINPVDGKVAAGALKQVLKHECVNVISATWYSRLTETQVPSQDWL